MQDKVEIIGSKISIWDCAESVQKIRELAFSNTRHFVCISNVHTVVTGWWDSEYATITHKATIATADGVPLIWASKLLSWVTGGHAIHGRACGPDIMAALLEDKQLRHFFYGSTPDVLKRVENKIYSYHPNAEWAGAYSPPMRGVKKLNEPLDVEELTELEIIDQAQPHIVWVGLGAPKQEIWMARVRPYLKTPVLISVGAAFDFLAGTKKRAPLWMQKSGLEWFYRFYKEPHRLAGRYLKTNPVFISAVAWQAARYLLMPPNPPRN